MCRGGTLPLRAICSINANCPPVSLPVARNVSSHPLYQTDRSRDRRPLRKATSVAAPTFSVTGIAIMCSLCVIRSLPLYCKRLFSRDVCRREGDYLGESDQTSGGLPNFVFFRKWVVLPNEAVLIRP